MSSVDFDLTDPKQFAAACEHSARAGGKNGPGSIAVDGLYCPTCGERRRMDFFWVQHKPPFGEMPRLALMECRQCHSVAFGLNYDGPNGPDLVIVRRVQGGLSTPNTPASVRFYLDQAARCEGSGARTAAVAMYRAALEQLLYEQGFTTGMLNAKITELETKTAAGTAPTWAPRLDTEFLRVLKELGNGDPPKRRRHDQASRARRRPDRRGSGDIRGAT
jgi:hypothetical protein